MMHFAHLRKGSSYIELVIAIALFAMLGGSLFVSGQRIFSYALKTKQEAEQYATAEALVYQLQNDFIQEMLVEKKMLEETYTKEYLVDGMAYTALVEPVPQESSLGKLVGLAVLKIYVPDLQNRKKLILFKYMSVPEVMKSTSKKEQDA